MIEFWIVGAALLLFGVAIGYWIAEHDFRKIL